MNNWEVKEPLEDDRRATVYTEDPYGPPGAYDYSPSAARYSAKY